MKRTLQQSFTEPRAVARQLCEMRLPLGTGLTALALMLVISVLLSSVVFGLGEIEVEPAMQDMLRNPLKSFGIQALILAVAGMLVHGIAGLFGGKGRLADLVLALAWIEAVMLLLQLAQVAALFVSPSLAEALGVMTAVLFLWMLVQVISEIYGFRSAGMVFLGFILTSLALGFVFAVLAILFTAKGI